MVTPDFQSIFEAVSGLHLILAPDLSIVAASDSYLRVTMTERASVLGRHVFEVFPDDPGDPTADGTANLAASLTRVIRDRVTDKMAIQKRDLRRPPEQGGGFEERFWSPTNSPVLGKDGELRYIVHQVEDVTVAVQLRCSGQALAQTVEAQVARANAAAQAASRELEAFSYAVAHDLRTPLRSIDGFSQALIEDHAEQLGAGGLDMLERVRRAAQRMGMLIDDLLQFSRIHQAELCPGRFDLGAMAASIVAELRAAEPARSVELVLAPDLVVEGDPQLLRVVLISLLGNAWKFTGPMPHSRIELSGAGDRTYFVRDNGVGFDMQYANKLFGAFQRLHSAVEFPGNGVGLAMVQRIVSRHGGRVWAEGTVGQGATFYFTL